MQRSRPGRVYKSDFRRGRPTATISVVAIGPFSDETLIIELLLDIRDMTTRILAILEEDDEEEDPEEDA